MWFDRLSKRYEDGVKVFLSFSKAHIQDDKISCPCENYENHKTHSIYDVRRHLYAYMIICSFQTRYLYGEVIFNIKQTSMNKGKESIVEKDVDNNMFDMINDLEEHFVCRPELFEAMINDVEMPLYDGCAKYTKLGALVKIWNIKASEGWMNSSFTTLLEFLKDVL